MKNDANLIADVKAKIAELLKDYQILSVRHYKECECKYLLDAVQEKIDSCVKRAVAECANSVGVEDLGDLSYAEYNEKMNDPAFMLSRLVGAEGYKNRAERDVADKDYATQLEPQLRASCDMKGDNACCEAVLDAVVALMEDYELQALRHCIVCERHWIMGVLRDMANRFPKLFLGDATIDAKRSFIQSMANQKVSDVQAVVNDEATYISSVCEQEDYKNCKQRMDLAN